MDDNKLANSVKHVMIVFLFCFVALISYITYFQVFKGPDIAENPANVRVIAKKNEVLRGTIYDRNGTPLTSSERESELTQKRTYLYGELFAHEVGYSDTTYGLTGLEAVYEDELTKSNSIGNGFRQFISTVKVSNLIDSIKEDYAATGKMNFKENFKKFVSNIGVSDGSNEKVGNGIVTTLDSALQQVAYDALGDNKGSVVALNPKTGEILAMVSKPSYDPNNLEYEITLANEGDADNSPLIDRSIDGLYPPGSVFKTVTLSSALENIPGIADRQFNDVGKITFADGSELNNFAYQAHGTIDLRYAYRVSSNFVFGSLAMELGNDKLKATAENFGFNSVIEGVGLTVTASRFPTLQSYEEGNIAQSGIGQGSVLATPMQMALVAATVANDGVMMEPKLVNKIVDGQGNTVKELESNEIRQVISANIASTVKGYMQYLVSNNIYRWPAFDGTNAGGKTGTADYKLADGTDAIPHGWFIAVAPIDDPQIAVAVIVENGESGATGAAEIASLVVRKAVLGY